MRLRLDPTAPQGVSLATEPSQVIYRGAVAGQNGRVESVVAGTNVTVDNTDPKNPIVSASGSGGGSGSGDVVGPASSTDNAIARFDLATGKLIQDSGVLIDDTDNITLPDAANIVLNSTTGTKIGTATTQKLGFFNATPVVQQTANTDIATGLAALGLRASGNGYSLSMTGSAAFGGAFRRSQTARVAGGTILITANSNNSVDATAGNINLVLPTTINANGHMFSFTRIDNTANTVTITAGSGWTINGAASITLQYNESVALEGNTATWNIVYKYSPTLDTITLTDVGTPASGDRILLQDVSDSNNLKYAQFSTFGGGGGSGITRSVVVTSGNVTAGATALTDYIYIISGAHTVTLPTAVGNTNRYTLKNSHTVAVALAFTSGQTADGSGITLDPDDSVDLISNNTEWKII